MASFLFLFYFFIFVFGLIVGSFLNCVIYRLSLFRRTKALRSFCPYCQHWLNWKDLIPVFSFLALKGKCRYCKKPISPQYPLVELATGILFFLIANLVLTCKAGSCISPFSLFTPFTLLHLLYLLFITSFLIIIFVFDLKYFIIPNKIIYPAIFVSGIWYLVSGIFFNFYTKYEILNTIYSALGASAFFLAIYLLSRGSWLGFGDVKLAFFIGLFLAFPNILVALFFAFFIGAIIGIGLIVSKKKKLKSEVPFGPFLVAGTFIALFWGKSMISWYLGLFNL